MPNVISRPVGQDRAHSTRKQCDPHRDRLQQPDRSYRHEQNELTLGVVHASPNKKIGLMRESTGESTDCNRAQYRAILPPMSNTSIHRHTYFTEKYTGKNPHTDFIIPYRMRLAHPQVAIKTPRIAGWSSGRTHRPLSRWPAHRQWF